MAVTYISLYLFIYWLIKHQCSSFLLIRDSINLYNIIDHALCTQYKDYQFTNSFVMLMHTAYSRTNHNLTFTIVGILISVMQTLISVEQWLLTMTIQGNCTETESVTKITYDKTVEHTPQARNYTLTLLSLFCVSNSDLLGNKV